MKQLSIEEKARHYDEAIKRLEDIKTGKCQKTFVFTEGLFEYIFPELVESGDERIRKELIKETKGTEVRLFETVTNDEFIAWLEKQGNKDEEILILKDQIESLHAAIIALKEVHKIELEKQGKNNMGISEATKKKLEDNLNKALEKETPESLNEFLEKQGEQKPVEEYNITGIGSKHAEGKLGEMIKNIKPVNEVSEQNPAWSEEDEKCIRLSTYIIDSALRENFCVKLDRDRCVDWLKSLKYRYIWKPSDEQLCALEHATMYNTLNANDAANLATLYNDLKKLKG